MRKYDKRYIQNPYNSQNIFKRTISLPSVCMFLALGLNRDSFFKRLWIFQHDKWDVHHCLRPNSYIRVKRQPPAQIMWVFALIQTSFRKRRSERDGGREWWLNSDREQGGWFPNHRSHQMGSLWNDSLGKYEARWWRWMPSLKPYITTLSETGGISLPHAELTLKDRFWIKLPLSDESYHDMKKCLRFSDFRA